MNVGIPSVFVTREVEDGCLMLGAWEVEDGCLQCSVFEKSRAFCLLVLGPRKIEDGYF